MRAVTIPDPENRDRRIEAFRRKVIDLGLDPNEYGYAEWLRNKNYLNTPFGSDEYGNCSICLEMVLDAEKIADSALREEYLRMRERAIEAGKDPADIHFDGSFYIIMHTKTTSVSYYTNGREIGPIRFN